MINRILLTSSEVVVDKTNLAGQEFPALEEGQVIEAKVLERLSAARIELLLLGKRVTSQTRVPLDRGDVIRLKVQAAGVPPTFRFMGKAGLPPPQGAAASPPASPPPGPIVPHAALSKLTELTDGLHTRSEPPAGAAPGQGAGNPLPSPPPEIPLLRQLKILSNIASSPGASIENGAPDLPLGKGEAGWRYSLAALILSGRPYGKGSFPSEKAMDRLVAELLKGMGDSGDEDRAPIAKRGLAGGASGAAAQKGGVAEQGGVRRYAEGTFGTVMGKPAPGGGKMPGETGGPLQETRAEKGKTTAEPPRGGAKMPGETGGPLQETRAEKGKTTAEPLRGGALKNRQKTVPAHRGEGLLAGRGASAPGGGPGESASGPGRGAVPGETVAAGGHKTQPQDPLAGGGREPVQGEGRSGERGGSVKDRLAGNLLDRLEKKVAQVEKRDGTPSPATGGKGPGPPSGLSSGAGGQWRQGVAALLAAVPERLTEGGELPSAFRAFAEELATALKADDRISPRFSDRMASETKGMVEKGALLDRMGSLLEKSALTSAAPDVKLLRRIIRSSGLVWENKVAGALTGEAPALEELAGQDLKALAMKFLEVPGEEGGASKVLGAFVDGVEKMQLFNAGSFDPGRYLLPLPFLSEGAWRFGQMLIDLGDREGKEKKQGDRVVRVAFLLDMSNLGALRADFSVLGKKISGFFTVGNDQAQRTIEAALPELSAHLRDRKFQVMEIRCHTCKPEALVNVSLADGMLESSDGTLNLII